MAWWRRTTIGASEPSSRWCLSRKNWLFAGSERGGQAAAVAFSLIETAKLNGAEPYAYLRDVLERINGHRQDRLHELLPCVGSRQRGHRRCRTRR
jgi:hypothetical protein